MNAMPKFERTKEELLRSSKLSNVKAVQFYHQKDDLDMFGSILDLENVALDLERATGVLSDVSVQIDHSNHDSIGKLNYMIQDLRLHSKKVWASFEDIHKVWCNVNEQYPGKEEALHLSVEQQNSDQDFLEAISEYCSLQGKHEVANCKVSALEEDARREAGDYGTLEYKSYLSDTEHKQLNNRCRALEDLLRPLEKYILGHKVRTADGLKAKLRHVVTHYIDEELHDLVLPMINDIDRVAENDNTIEDNHDREQEYAH